MKKTLSLLLAFTLLLTLLAGCSGSETEEAKSDQSALYEQVMARFDGNLEQGAVVKVLENDTAVELGYVDALIDAFNEAYKDKGISAERMNVDQYSDLATDGPYGYGPDVWYQANDILMKYADKQHILPLPVQEMDCYEQIPQSAWDAYATDMNGETFYCGIPVNVQSGMLYYIESSLPQDWQTNWDVNQNGTPDFFETYTALYAYSELCKQGGQPTQYGYLDETVDTYFMSGYLMTFGAYIFGDNGTNPSDIGLAAGDAVKGARMIRQWAGEMNNTEVLDKSFSSAAYQYLADRVMLCTVTTPDVYRMFIRSMTATGNWTEEEAMADLKMITVPRLPVSGDLTSDHWEDTVLQQDTLTTETKMMGGINGYGISAYTKCPNASLAFVEFATAYAQVVLRNQYLGVAPARADAAATISETDPTVGILFDRLDRGYISIMPAITEIGQLWTPAESFLIDLSTDPYREERGEALLFTTDAEIQAGLDRLCTQIRDAIETLS
ncbi:MAG: hypothetical protein ACI3V2_06185 [Faecousia sp.]